MTVLVTGKITDATGREDSRRWRAYSPVYREGSNGEVVNIRPQSVRVVAGHFTAELEPGIVVIENPEGTRYTVTVPNENANLWDIIEQSVAVPPATPADLLAAAVETFVENNEGYPWGGVADKPAALSAIAGLETEDFGLDLLTVGDAEAGRQALEAASADDVDGISTDVASISALVKTGDPWWNAVMAAPAEMPTITMATSSQIGSGTTLSPTADYYYDPYFRYDGCVSVQSSSGGVSSVNGSPEFVMPEHVTDAQDVEFIVRAARTGTNVMGVRAIVNGKLHNLTMQRFTTTGSTDYYFKLHFAAQKVRHIKFEHDGGSIFKGVVLSSHVVAQRPKGPHQNRHIAIGDSLTVGGPNYHIGAEISGDLFYMSRECHAYYQSVLMGCDSFINLGDGGTGWGDNDLIDGPFSGRIDKALAGNPHVLGFYGSRNDVGFESQVLGRVIEALARVEEVPVVLVCGPQQTLSTTTINELVRQGVVAAGRTFLDVQGAAASPSSNPTGHPTIAEQQNIAKIAHAQLDMTRLTARVEGANAARQPVAATLTTSPSSPVNVSTSVILTATLAGNASALLGKIQFYDGATALGSPVTVSSGVATYTTSALAAVTHSLTAKFLPTNPSTVKASTSNTVTFVVSANLGMVDTFTRADGAIGTSENGKAWDNTTYPGWDIVSGAAGFTGATSNKTTVCLTGAVIGHYRWKMAGTFATQAQMLLFCSNPANPGRVDGSNHVYMNCGGGSNHFRLFTRISNASTPMGTGTTNAGWVAGDEITIDVTQGSSPTKFTFAVGKNGTPIFTVSDYDIGSLLAGKDGIGLGITSASNLSRFDEVEMVPA